MALRKVKYPAVRRADTFHVCHGTNVPAPYAWLENPDAEETSEFVDAQNALFKEAMADADFTTPLREEMTKLRKYARTGAPNRGRSDNEYYFYHNPGLANQSILMRLKAPIMSAAGSGGSAEPEVFFDANKLSDDGTVALSSTGWSHSRKYWAYALSEKGSDWMTIHVRDADLAADDSNNPKDVCKWVKYSGISFFRDRGFFYTKFPAPQKASDAGKETDKAQDGALMFHALGTSQDEDLMVVQAPASHREWIPSGGVTDDQKYLVLSWSDGCERKNLLWIAELPTSADQKMPAGDEWKFNKLVDTWVAEYEVVANNDETFFVKVMSKDCPNGKLMQIDVKDGAAAMDKAEVLVPEDKQWPLESVEFVGDYVILLYLEKVKHVFYLTSLGSAAVMAERRVQVPLPIGSIVSWACRRDSPFISVKMASFVLPGRTYVFSLPIDKKPEGKLEPKLTMWRDEGPEGFNGDDFVVEQHFYPSPSGETPVPMFVCRHKDIKVPADAVAAAAAAEPSAADGDKKAPQNANAPALVYGYGGFSISISPSFSLNAYLWMARFGGVYAIANIRGGSEYGEAWADAGKKFNKINCFDDFAAGARYLQRDLRLTTPARTAIMGGSNGGLLVAATALRYPHLFGAGVSQVGVLDIHRFHLFTIGSAWRSDYLDPDVEEEFRYQQKYSPVHNVRSNVHYPALLMTCGDHDDRVVPLHSHIFTATMQHASPDFGGPILERIDKSAGHGGGKPLSKVIDEAVDTYSFIALAIGAKYNAGDSSSKTE